MKVLNQDAQKIYNELDSNRLLSEAEACNIAGITLDTLKSYTQFSLLKPVIRNQKPFYRISELTQLFNLQIKPENELADLEPEYNKINNSAEKIDTDLPTLEKLLEPENITTEEVIESEPTVESKYENLPALRIEDILLQNQSLNTRIKSLEDERDWLRRRVEMLEERSAREQMLMLKEKETLSEVINATLVREKENNTQRFSFKNYIKRLALPFFGE